MKQSEIKIKKRDLTNLNYNVPNNSKIYIAMGNKQDNGANECYTSYNSAKELVEYIVNKNIIDKDKKIWFPFDCEDSNIYLAFKDNGFTNLVYTHIENGEDFYDTNIECDYIISNPPFSKTLINGVTRGRTDLFKRLFELNKPFIMLQPVQMLNNSTIIKHLTEKSNDLSFICPEKRIGFIIGGVYKPTPAFYSYWFCWKINNEKMWNNICIS